MAVQFGSQDTAGLIGSPIDRTTDSSAISDWSDKSRVEPTQTGTLLDISDSVGDDHVDDAVLQISGAGHWFLEGWIGDHSVEHRWGHWDAPQRTLRGANGTGIGVSGFSHCVVSFM